MKKAFLLLFIFIQVISYTQNRKGYRNDIKNDKKQLNFYISQNNGKTYDEWITSTLLRISSSFYGINEPDSAIMYLKLAYNLCPNDETVLLRMGNYYFDKNQLDSSLLIYKTLNKMYPLKFYGEYELSEIYYEYGQYNKSLEILNNILKEKEKNKYDYFSYSREHLDRAWVYYMLDSSELALEDLEHVWKNETKALKILCLEDLERFDEAYKEIKPIWPPFRNGKIKIVLARYYAHKENPNYKKAIKILNPIISKEDTSYKYEAMYYRSTLLTETKQYQKAEQDFNTLISYGEDYVYLSKAKNSFYLESYKDAIHYFQQHIEFCPFETDEANYYLGLSYINSKIDIEIGCNLIKKIINNNAEFKLPNECKK